MRFVVRGECSSAELNAAIRRCAEIAFGRHQGWVEKVVLDWYEEEGCAAEPIICHCEIRLWFRDGVKAEVSDSKEDLMDAVLHALDRAERLSSRRWITSSQPQSQARATPRR